MLEQVDVEKPLGIKFKDLKSEQGGLIVTVGDPAKNITVSSRCRHHNAQYSIKSLQAPRCAGHCQQGALFASLDILLHMSAVLLHEHPARAVCWAARELLPDSGCGANNTLRKQARQDRSLPTSSL